MIPAGKHGQRSVNEWCSRCQCALLTLAAEAARCVMTSPTNSNSPNPTSSASSIDAMSSGFPEARIDRTEGINADTCGFLDKRKGAQCKQGRKTSWAHEMSLSIGSSCCPEGLAGSIAPSSKRLYLSSTVGHGCSSSIPAISIAFDLSIVRVKNQDWTRERQRHTGPKLRPASRERSEEGAKDAQEHRHGTSSSRKATGRRPFCHHSKAAPMN